MNSKKQKRELEKTKRYFEVYKEKMINELNFRILCETEKMEFATEQTLWIEDISITNVVYENAKPKRSFERMAGGIKKVIHNLKNKYLNIGKKLMMK